MELNSGWAEQFLDHGRRSNIAAMDDFFYLIIFGPSQEFFRIGRIIMRVGNNSE
jgi:hypothetical protein